MKNKAFTLIELLVVIAVVAIISAVVFGNYRAGERIFALQRSAHKFSQDIRRAEEMAMSAKVSKKRNPEEVPPGGYGVYFTKNATSYIIYSDGGNQVYGGDVDVQEEILFFERGVYIKETSPSSDNFSINFKPPDPIVTIKDSLGVEKNTVEITLALESDPDSTRTVTVNKFGLIEVK